MHTTVWELVCTHREWERRTGSFDVSRANSKSSIGREKGVQEHTPEAKAPWPLPPPSVCFATPTAALARSRLASAAARTTRAGAITADTIPLARFISRVYSLLAPQTLRKFLAHYEQTTHRQGHVIR